MPEIGTKPKESTWSGREGFAERFDLNDPATQNILNQLLQQGSQGLQGIQGQPYQGQNLLTQLLGSLGGNRGNFDPIAQQETSRFFSQTVPTLAERFTAMGTGGSQRSSAFQGALGQAGAGLSESLAAMKSQYGQQQQSLDQGLLQLLLGGLQNHQGQQQNSLLAMLQAGMQPRYETIYRNATPGIKQPFMQGLGAAAGTGINLLLNKLTGGGYGLANAGLSAVGR